MRRVGCTLAAVCAVFAAAAGVQTPKAGEVLVRLETSLGSITLAIDTARAPIAAANFSKYVGVRRRRPLPSRDTPGQLQAGATQSPDGEFRTG